MQYYNLQNVFLVFLWYLFVLRENRCSDRTRPCLSPCLIISYLICFVSHGSSHNHIYNYEKKHGNMSFEIVCSELVIFNCSHLLDKAIHTNFSMSLYKYPVLYIKFNSIFNNYIPNYVSTGNFSTVVSSGHAFPVLISSNGW